MRCKLTRITDNDHTRTREMIGECSGPPTVGRSFVIINDAPLKEGYTNRMIETTQVQYTTSIFDSPKKIRFMTVFTTYDWEELN